MRIPEFFIVGAPKCGTTAINDYLSVHPDIFMARKEIHYFGSDLQMRDRISEQKYLDYFNGAGTSKILGEASVWYLFSKTAAKEIKKFSPKAKALIMLRNPVEVIYSLHRQNLYDGNEDVTNFEKALSLDDQRKEGFHQPKSLDFFRLPPYKESVLYYEQVKRYIEVFGSEDLCIVLYEDFIVSPQKTLQEILSFLGVDKNLDVHYALINANKEIRNFNLHRIMRHPSSQLKKMVRLALPNKAFRHKLMTRLFKWNIKIRQREQMRPKTSVFLKDFFKDDVRKLGQLINRDLSGWLK